MAIDNHDLSDLIKAVYGELEKKFTKVELELSEIKKLINEPVPMGTIDRRKSEVIVKRMEAPSQQVQRQVRSPFPQIVRKPKPVQEPEEDEDDDDDFDLEEEDDEQNNRQNKNDADEVQI